MARIDYDRAAATYDRGRALPDESRAAWRPVLDAALDGRRVERWVDVGSGTGIWTVQLAGWFDCDVIGVERSAGMRGAAARRVGTGARYVAGRAEALPLAAGSCDSAWLSTVIHHVDRPAAAAEVARVLRPGAPVCIRSSFPERAYGFAVEQFFPEVRRVWDTFPTVAETRAAFEAAGCSFEALVRVPEPHRTTLADVRAGVPRMRHADTLLAGLTDEEFERGLERLDAAVAAGEPYPSDGLDLLLLRVR